MQQFFNDIAFSPADILLPDAADLTRWSVVACDQYTSEPAYWQAVDNYVGDAPSALRMMLPELYLEQAGVEERIRRINEAMERYLRTGVFHEYKNALIHVRRTLSDGRVRSGLVGKLDLEAYEFSAGSGSLIRPTEGTVLSRIPPRVRMRENALLEMPHVMVLIDDPGHTVVEPAGEGAFETVYDFELMKQGGHISGRLLDNAAAEGAARALSALCDADAFARKTGLSGRPVLAYAVGDGNHSLATAKACWEQLKPSLDETAQKNHPARYALAELVNIHDPSLEFEPIHRVVFGADPAQLLNEMKRYYPACSEGSGNGHVIGYTYGEQQGSLCVQNPKKGLAVGTLQDFLDDYLARSGGRIDYIHGADVVRTLSRKPGNIGFLLPAMGKSELFTTVITDGVLPRKTFSMGEAHDKRFYLECRRIR